MDGSAIYTDLLLVGKTGNGKSATGNSILGRKMFIAAASVTSVTKTAVIEYSEISGRIVKVVDGPGLFDTDLSEVAAKKLVIDSIRCAIAANPRGYHAILLVVRWDVRVTNEDKQTVEVLKRVFGSDFVEKFVILVVTHGDAYDPVENNGRSFNEWCSTQTGVFRELISECNNRVILFDNRTQDENKKNYQRECLFKMVDNLSSTGQRYSNDDFKKAKIERDRILKEAKIPFIREETMMEASLIIQELGKIQLAELDQRLTMLHHLKSRSERILENIKVQQSEHSVLQDAVSFATNVNQSIDDQIANTTSAIDIQNQNKLREAEIEALKAQENLSRQEQYKEKAKEKEQEIQRLQKDTEEKNAQCQVLIARNQEINTAAQQNYQQFARKENISFLSMCNVL